MEMRLYNKPFLFVCRKNGQKTEKKLSKSCQKSAMLQALEKVYIACIKEEVCMEMFQDFIVVIVMGICFCIGYIIKHSLSFINNKYIPLIMGVLGVVLNVWLNGWVFTPEVLLGGLASGLASTGAFELVKNIKS